LKGSANVGTLTNLGDPDDPFAPQRKPYVLLRYDFLSNVAFTNSSLPEYDLYHADLLNAKHIPLPKGQDIDVYNSSMIENSGHLDIVDYASNLEDSKDSMDFMKSSMS
jgi:hypothetical protein